MRDSENVLTNHPSNNISQILYLYPLQILRNMKKLLPPPTAKYAWIYCLKVEMTADFVKNINENNYDIANSYFTLK